MCEIILKLNEQTMSQRCPKMGEDISLCQAIVIDIQTKIKHLSKLKKVYTDNII
jgi:hypothetical protein